MARTVDPARYAARRRQILDAAAGCFAADGFERTTIAGICAAAGISSGSLFHYFRSKDAVFRELFAEDGREAAAVLAAAARRDDPWAGVLDVVGHLTGDLDRPEVVGLVVALTARIPHDAELAETLERDDAALVAGLTALLERAAAAGRTDGTVAPAAAARWITVLADGLALHADDPAGARRRIAELPGLLERWLGVRHPHARPR